jgi:alginate O-acetyltransferase complex protein AlgI
VLFNSQLFLYGFLPISLLGYYGAAHLCGARAARVWLCAASCVFYAWWKPPLVLLLIGSIAFNYCLSLYLVGGESSNPSRQGRILAAGVAANLLLLFYYKYLFSLLGYFHALGWTSADAGSVILPIGISFFTFTQIGYLVDCRQGLVRDRSPLNYVLFVTFFPHLIAGPILHHREVMPQFADDETYKLRVQNIAVGVTLFAVGLFKKVMLADWVGPWAELGFSDVRHLHLVQAWLAALAYSMQLYFDFSGYSDMAIGLGIMFAIRLPLNFNSPYQSLSIIDFWQRWHITLTRYLTLLVYNPLALRVGRYRQRAGLAMNRPAAATPSGFASMIAFPTFATTLLAGIWHGGALPFILYGALHGVYLCVNHVWRLHRAPFEAPTPLRAAALYSILWRAVLTYGAVLLAEIVFRAKNVLDAAMLVGGMLGLHGAGLPMSASLGYHCAFVVALGAIAFGAPNVYQMLNDRSPALTRLKPLRRQFLAWRPTRLSAAGIGALFAAAALYCERTTQFLYFQF